MIRDPCGSTLVKGEPISQRTESWNRGNNENR